MASLAAAHRHEQILGLPWPQQLVARLPHVALHPLQRHLPKRHQALFRTLAHHTQYAFAQADIKHLHLHQLAHPQAAGVHQLQHGAVALAQRRARVGRGQQGLHLRFRQRLGHPKRLLGSFEPQGRVGHHQLLAQSPAKVAPQHRQTPVGGGGAGLCMALGEVALNIDLLGLQQRCRVQPLRKQLEVAPVRLQGVFGQALLQPQRIHKGVDGCGIRH
jgi:hypothetical protein